jgi:hypothetical protein
MKKLLITVLTLTMVLALAAPAFTASNIGKSAYDAFGGKAYTANNNTVVLDADYGIELQTNSQSGWYIVVTKDTAGKLDIAYKIGSDYFLRTIEIDSNKNTSYRIGDGSGKDGLNQVKIGGFVPLAVKPAPETGPAPSPEPYPPSEPSPSSSPAAEVDVGFVGYYLHEGNVLSTSIYWQKLHVGDMIDWSAVRSAYDKWADQGGLMPPNPIEGWQSSGYASIYFSGSNPAIGYSDFTSGMLESQYLAYYLDPGYAIDDARAYTVVYDANGGTGNPPKDTRVYLSGETLTVSDRGGLDREWHTFLGWAITADGPVAYTPNQKFAVHGDTTLYAVWNEYEKFTVLYDGNGNTGGSPPSDTAGTVALGNIYYKNSLVTVLDKGTLTKSGHAFRGWALSSGGPAAYNPGGQFNITGEVTLRAVWLSDNAQTYTVTYQPGSRGIFEAQSYENLSLGAETPPTPTVKGAEGWAFSGWNPPLSAKVTENTTYVAGWTQKIYDVEFEDRDGTTIMQRNVAHGGNAVLPPDPELEGFVFAGWDIEATDIRDDTIVTAMYTPQTLPAVADNHHWALLNLLFAVAGALLALASAGYLLARRWNGHRHHHHERTREKWLITAILTAVAGLVVFALTQNMRNPMVWVDMWTVANAALFAATAASMVLVLKRYSLYENR